MVRGDRDAKPGQQQLALLDVSDDIRVGEPFPKACLAAMENLWDEADFQESIRRGNGSALHDNLR